MLSVKLIHVSKSMEDIWHADIQLNSPWSYLLYMWCILQVIAIKYTLYVNNIFYN